MIKKVKKPMFYLEKVKGTNKYEIITDKKRFYEGTRIAFIGA